MARTDRQCYGKWPLAGAVVTRLTRAQKDLFAIPLKR
jgi:hypothetical protein